MKEKFKTILFVASVSLNVVFAATYLVYKLPLLTGLHQQRPIEPLFLQLDMTTDQLARFRVEHARFIEQLQEPDQEIKSKQVELIDLLGAPSPDHQAIVKKHEEIQHLQGAVQGRIIDHFLRASTLLTAEQRTRFFELIKTRMATNAQVCPPWMRPLEHGNTREK